MSRLFGVRAQTALVVVLFVGSLAVLLFSTWTTLALPQREIAARAQLHRASREMARDAKDLGDVMRGLLNPNRDEEDEKLRAIS